MLPPDDDALRSNGESTPSTSNGINVNHRIDQTNDYSPLYNATLDSVSSESDDPINHIDPPQGFDSPTDTTTAKKSNKIVNSTKFTTRTTGSSGSSLTSSSPSVSNRDPFDSLSRRAVTNNADGTTDREMRDSRLNSRDNESNHDHDTARNHDIAPLCPAPSTSSSKTIPPCNSASSYPRFVNGISTIVTKISKAFANTSISMISTERCLQDDLPKFVFSHKRSLEKTWKLMDKVVKGCQRPGMNLNNSPPFILEIVPETYQHLKLIHTKYDNSNKYPNNDDEYSRVFLQNLQARCKQTLKLFKDAKEEMFNEKSEYRHKLTRHTLVFNHILSELRAIFPNGRFIGGKYLITKKETAGEFWKNNFGTSVLVDWRTFYHALQLVHSIDSSFFSLNALKQTIDLTCDDYISIFEFDVFTRLFQPWTTLLRNWQILAVTHPGYKAFLTYDELKARLQKHIDKPGSYVFRLSCTRLGQWAIGYVTPDRQILQTIVQNISLSQALTETKFYLYPDGKDEDPNLNVLCSGMANDDRNVTVTEEQYEIYCGVGNSFQTCKICFENDKDIRVEPCNHLLCTSCLIAWQEREGFGCPYCRTEIKETVQITMDLPKGKEK